MHGGALAEAARIQILGALASSPHEADYVLISVAETLETVVMDLLLNPVDEGELLNLLRQCAADVIGSIACCPQKKHAG